MLPKCCEILVLEISGRGLECVILNISLMHLDSVATSYEEMHQTEGGMAG